MAFNKFVKVRGRSFTPKVGIWARGQIGFNRGAMEKFSLDKYNYVVLYFDSDSRRIGIKFTNNAKEEGAIKIVKRPTAISFSATGFLKTYEIDHSESKQYNVEYDEKEEMYVAQL